MSGHHQQQEEGGGGGAGGTKLWGGRFGNDKVDPLMTQFNESIHFDKRFWRVDIEGSKGMVVMTWRRLMT